jgi:hypothetical protein
MSSPLPLFDLDVVGHVGRVSRQDWPVRLLPVYRSRTQPVALLPPFTERAGYVQGIQTSAAALDERIDEGEITAIETSFSAKGDHSLWLDESGLKYMPHADAEQALNTLCRNAVKQALEGELSERSTRVRLFRSLRARPTSVANALLSVHFQLNSELSLVKPIREDLSRLSKIDPVEAETEMVQLIALSNPTRQVLSAIAEELRRAGRKELAQTLMQGSPAEVDRAAWPALPMRWADVVGHAA